MFSQYCSIKSIKPIRCQSINFVRWKRDKPPTRKFNFRCQHALRWTYEWLSNQL